MFHPSLVARFAPLAAGFFIAFLAGCDSSKDSISPASAEADTVASFVVGSDLHYMSPALLTDTSTADFHAYLASDRKMLVQSPALLHSFLDSIRAAKPRFVLLTGDLTKDGEKRSHQDLADSLETLRSLGIAVYVVPGNHDVHNPEAESYGSAGAASTPPVTAAEFATIYNSCGYGQAIARDTASLSYVVDIMPGVRLLAMDPIRWRDNIGVLKETVGGRFLPQTMAWIRTQLRAAKADGKVVVGAMHHGVVEHFAGQSTNPISADYVVAGFDSVGKAFVAEGLHVVFTGHFHANDIATRSMEQGTLTDIETGSLVTAPSPYRKGSIHGTTISVETSAIREISQNLGGASFVEWSKTFLLTGMTQISHYTLTTQFGVDTTTARSLAPVVASAYAKHYSGDETMDPTSSGTIALLESKGTASATFLGTSLKALLTDPAPSDASGSFSLR